MDRSFGVDFSAMEESIRFALEKKSERRPKPGDPFLPGDLVRLDDEYVLVVTGVTTSVVRVAPVFKYAGPKEREIDNHPWVVYLHEHFLVFEKTLPVYTGHLRHTGVASDPDVAHCVLAIDEFTIDQMVESLSEEEYEIFHDQWEAFLKLSKKYSFEALAIGVGEYEEGEATC